MPAAKPLSRRAFLGASAGVAGGAVLAGPLARSAGAASARADLALTHVTVVDVTSGRSQHDMTVLVAGDRIRAIGRSADIGIPAHVKTLDLTGKYLIPGLCDVHVHSSDENIDLPMHIANGVTTVREMWGLPTIHEWRQKIQAGTLLGPRYVIGSPIIDGSPTLWNDSAPRPAAPIVVSTEAQGRQAVRAVKRDGADFIKVYSRLSRAAFNGIADEARRQRIRFGGHVPDVVPVEDAVRAGMWSFEHLDGLWWSTSGRESRLRREIARIQIDPKDAYESWFEQIGRLEWEAATSYRPDKANALFSLLRRNDAWQVPTLTMLQRLDTPGDPGDPRMKYVPAETAAYWQIWSDTVNKGRTAEQIAQHRELFELRQQLVSAMARAGVPILAGTDTGTTYLFPGFSLHDEMALLVKAGLSPAHALRAATYEPARFLGLEHSQGTVSKGKLADLVVLDADPLADIANTQRIHAVLVGGQLISSAQRAQLLANAAKAASGSAAAAVARCGCHAHAH